MKQSILTLVAALAFSVGSLAHAAAEIGKPAPEFTAVDTNGKTHSLSDLKGKFVVLEWLNYDCPFVKKHYGADNMQKLQRKYTAKGVTWLSVISSAKGKQGNFPAATINQMSAERKAAPTAILIDEDGKVGKAYDAKTTPHMFVISPAGNLIYAGAIDDKPTADKEDIATAKNFVAAALDEALAAKDEKAIKVTVASHQAYGCGVKY